MGLGREEYVYADMDVAWTLSRGNRGDFAVRNAGSNSGGSQLQHLPAAGRQLQLRPNPAGGADASAGRESDDLPGRGGDPISTRMRRGAHAGHDDGRPGGNRLGAATGDEKSGADRDGAADQNPQRSVSGNATDPGND